MLTVKYAKNFLEIYDKINNMGQIIESIIETEKTTGVELLNWEDDQIVTFLKQFKSVSPNSLYKKMQVLRKFANMICKKEKLPLREYAVNDGVTMQCIDREELLHQTLTYSQYLNIKNQLDIEEDGKRINVRDKIIFELAWSSLTNDDIRLLKESDIEINEDNTGLYVAILHLKNRIVRIDDQEIIEDIKLCMKEKFIVSVSVVGKRRQIEYKSSEYLCKPAKIGKDSIKTYLDQPNLALQKLFKNGQVICEGIKIEGLSLEDITRSRMIYLLAPENADIFDTQTVAALYNLTNKTSINWVRTIAREMYPID